MIVRDALTRPRVCRPGTHTWSGDRCSECRCRNVEGAACVMAPRRAGGLSVNVLGIRPAAGSRDERGHLLGKRIEPDKADPSACINGHVGRWYHSPRGKRTCRDCNLDAHRRRRERMAA